MKPVVTVALTNLYSEFKILMNGFTDFVTLSVQQDKVISFIQPLFDAMGVNPSEEDEPEEVISYVFMFTNIRSGVTLAIAELPHDKEIKMALLNEVISDTMSLDVPYGADYTLIPIPDPAYNVLIRLSAAHRYLMAGRAYLTDLMSARDRCIKYVETLFGTHKRIVMETKEDIAKYVAFQRKHAAGYFPVEVDRVLLPTFQPLLDDIAKTKADEAAGITIEEIEEPESIA